MMTAEYRIIERTRRVWPLPRRWWWIIQSVDNGQTLATSETYTSELACYTTSARLNAYANLGGSFLFVPLPETSKPVNFDPSRPSGK